MRHIVRSDDHGHRWRVEVWRQKKLLFKYFPDTEHGGTAQALTAAMAWRDSLVIETTNADYTVWRREVMMVTNTSGVVGVSRGVSHRTKNGQTAYYWQAHWVDVHGKRHTRGFNIGKYGEEGAKDMAMRARQDGLQELARQIQLSQLRSSKNAQAVPTPLSQQKLKPKRRQPSYRETVLEHEHTASAVAMN